MFDWVQNSISDWKQQKKLGPFSKLFSKTFVVSMEKLLVMQFPYFQFFFFI